MQSKAVKIRALLFPDLQRVGDNPVKETETGNKSRSGQSPDSVFRKEAVMSSSFKRTLVLAFLCYMWGIPALSPLRPAVVDQAVAEFHETVNEAAASVRPSSVRRVRVKLPGFLRDLERVSS